MSLLNNSSFAFSSQKIVSVVVDFYGVFFRVFLFVCFLVATFGKKLLGFIFLFYYKKYLKIYIYIYQNINRNYTAGLNQQCYSTFFFKKEANCVEE